MAGYDVARHNLTLTREEIMKAYCVRVLENRVSEETCCYYIEAEDRDEVIREMKCYIKNLDESVLGIEEIPTREKVLQYMRCISVCHNPEDTRLSNDDKCEMATSVAMHEDAMAVIEIMFRI